MMLTVLTLLLWLLALILVAVTLLPMLGTKSGIIRMMDFPRLQIAFAAAAVLVVAAATPMPGRVLIPLAMLAVCGYQLWRILPYTILARTELKLAPNAEDDVRILSVNVLMENDRHADLAGIIADFDPHILLLMETDEAWVSALEPLLARYETVIREPRDDHYGMIFATRLPVDEARVMHLTVDETPSIFAQLNDPKGRCFRFVGLHPKPPLPGEGTEDRDAQILYAARFARKANVPLVATGDFNDVAWSDTSQTFKHVGRYLDPRIGRGLYASFDATKPYLRFPIDQFYVSREVAVVSLKRLSFFGSDHFPMAATVRFDAKLAEMLNEAPRPISDEEEALIKQSVDRTRDELGHVKMN